MSAAEDRNVRVNPKNVEALTHMGLILNHNSANHVNQALALGRNGIAVRDLA